MAEYVLVHSSVVEGEEYVEERVFRFKSFAITLRARDRTSLYSFKAINKVVGYTIMIGVFFFLFLLAF